MFRTKTIILFFVKAIVIYLFLSASFQFYDVFYGNLYSKSNQWIFDRFNHYGFIKLVPKDKPSLSTFYVGNYTQIKADGKVHCAIYELNTRHFGYLPTILLISLILASPVNWKRMLIALFIGIILISGFAILKQWIYILHICIEKPWLMLYEFSESRKHFIEHIFNSYVSPTAPSLVLTVIIWILVTFNIRDLAPKETSMVKKVPVRKIG